ncbi:hypothetical protein PMSD_25185 [Paenibacillus macquariensis subsp. defensor]|nr:hypothetical protein PMSD_25185 [Paenibacillus macquariensis subsp. defensor]
MRSKMLNFSWDDADAEAAASVNVSEHSRNDIAVIGIACQFPKAKDLSEYWDNLRSGKDCVDRFPLSRRKDADRLLMQKSYSREDISFIECGYLDEVDCFDYQFFGYSLKEAILLDPAQRLFLQASYHCLEDAGYSSAMLRGTNTGVYLGYSNDFETERTYKRFINELENEVNAMALVGNMRAVISARIAHFLDLRGPNLTIDTTCSSSLVAIHTACQALRNSECDLAIAGGVELHLLPFRGQQSEQMGIEASDYRTKSFDNRSDGSGNGEGVGAVLLKPLSKAVADNDHIYCIVKGGAINQNGSSISITVPNARAQEELLVKAWDSSGIDPETLSFLEAHGSGTPLGDPIEMEGFKRAFEHYTDKKQFCALGSVKTNMGHLGGAAGIASFIKMCKCLQERKLVPMLHFKEPNQSIPFYKLPVYINDELCKWDSPEGARRAGISSYGLSGTNCHVVLEEYAEKGGHITRNENPHHASIFAISAKTDMALRRLAEAYVDFLQQQMSISWNDLCGTVIHGREHYACRIAFIATDIQEVIRHLQEWLRLPSFKKTESLQAEMQMAGNKPWSSTGPDSPLSDDKLEEICRLYVNGADIPWNHVWNRRYTKTPLPLYSFEQSRCWFDIQRSGNLFNKIEWKLDAAPVHKTSLQHHKILLIHDEEDIGHSLYSLLEGNGASVSASNAAVFHAHMQSGAKAVKTYVEELLERGITDLIYLPSDLKPERLSDPSSVQEYLNMGLYSFHSLVQGIMDSRMKAEIAVYIIAQQIHGVTGSEETLNPVNAALFGYASAVNSESNVILCRCIDIDNNMDAWVLANELFSDSPESIVAYRDNKRYIKNIGLLRCASK